MHDTLLHRSVIFSQIKEVGQCLLHVSYTGYSNSIDDTRLYISLQLFVDAQSPTSLPQVPLKNDPLLQGLIHDQCVTVVFH